MDELVEERPVPGALVRHRGARMERHEGERAAPRLELQHGALWIRATPAGPGVLASHGATTVQVRDGAAVLEVNDFEALLMVISGRAAVKGTAALPRSVTAGQAVTLSLDGEMGTPEVLSPEELAADRFVTENLARDALVAVVPEREAPASGPETVGEPGGAPSSTVPIADPATGETATPLAAAPPGGEAATGTYFDPAPLAVPGPEPRPDDELGLPEQTRRGLVVVVIVLVILAAVVGAIVLTGDEPSSAPAPTTPTVPPAAVTAVTPTAAEAVAEATVRSCEPRIDGYVVAGVASGGPDDVERYDVTVGLEDGAGEVYVEKMTTAAAGDGPDVEVGWSVELAVSASEIRPDSECRIVEVDTRP